MGSLKSGVIQTLTILTIIHWSENRGHKYDFDRRLKIEEPEKGPENDVMNISIKCLWF